MAIVFDPANRTYTLHTEHTSYQLQADRFDRLLHLYYGQRSEGCFDYLLSCADRGFSGNPYEAGDERSYSMDALPQEFPVQGTGDFRSPLLIVRDENGTFGCDLKLKSHAIRPGKYALAGLPAVYADAEDDGAETLELVLENERLGLRVTLLYGVLPKLDIITRAAVAENCGGGTLTVEKFQSACLDFVSGDFDLICFHGRHAMERLPERRALRHGATVIGSRRGYSSHQYNPFVILADRGTTETSGRCWAMQFVYSGGFEAEAELDQFGQTRLQMGLAEEKFSYPLRPGETLTAPEVILTYSGAGLERLSHNLHRCLRRHVCRGKYRDAVRPLLLNSWEASYFDFSGASLLALAQEAKELGVEMLVMDDGWFGERRDDRRALGDWTANEEKLGGTLGELVEKVNALGLKFGIWMEPEMISEDSELYRQHPDWALAIPGEGPVRSRSQLVLDLSRPEVCGYLFDSLCRVLDQGNIEYLKWDANRSIAEAYSRAGDQGAVLYRYMLGLYGLLERLVRRYPDLLLEGCSGGGGRFDAGMLYYSPQIWASDNTDPIERMAIQFGTSLCYPASTMGAHVSTSQRTGFVTKGNAAIWGTDGFELDPNHLTDEDKAIVKQQVADYHKYYELIHYGDLYRVISPWDNAYRCAWEFVSPDKAEMLYTQLVMRYYHCPTQIVRFKGLDPEKMYTLESTGEKYSGALLMNAGMNLSRYPRNTGDSFTLHFIAEA